ncbi:helix-turn-helix domain-containing protein [Chloroflexota bacterium]
MAMEKLAVSVVEAARLISVSKSTAYALIEQGHLPAVRVGEKRLIVPVKALEAWLEKQSEAQQ